MHLACWEHSMPHPTEASSEPWLEDVSKSFTYLDDLAGVLRVRPLSPVQHERGRVQGGRPGWALHHEDGAGQSGQGRLREDGAHSKMSRCKQTKKHLQLSFNKQELQDTYIILDSQFFFVLGQVLWKGL